MVQYSTYRTGHDRAGRGRIVLLNAWINIRRQNKVEDAAGISCDAGTVLYTARPLV
jgi:hypothetical protein